MNWQTEQVQMAQASSLEWLMLELINEERSSRGIDPLKLELRLNDSAEDHSEWMLQTDTFSHTGAGGSSAGDRIADTGFTFSGSWSWGENIAWQSVRGEEGLADDVRDLHNNLMNSASHRANILNPDVTVIGIGLERGSFEGWDALMATQNFAHTSATLQLDTKGGGTPEPGAEDDVLTLSVAGTLNGFGGDDRLTGSNGSDKLIGASGEDTLSGGNGRDNLQGGDGNDVMFGNAGKDYLYGGSGSDRIDGGRGNDRLTGNDGNDVFIFNRGYDVVRDFEARNSGEDIDLSRAVGINGFNDLASNHMIQKGDNVRIRDADGNVMLLQNTDLADLASNDFLF